MMLGSHHAIPDAIACATLEPTFFRFHFISKRSKELLILILLAFFIRHRVRRPQPILILRPRPMYEDSKNLLKLCGITHPAKFRFLNSAINPGGFRRPFFNWREQFP